MSENLIACAQHDYFEIACLYRYKLRLTLKDQHTVTGTAKDLTLENKREFLVLEDSTLDKIELTKISNLEVLTPNAQFKQLDF